MTISGGSAVPIRYMGTKRHVAHHVRRAVAGIKPRGPIVDLFSGLGCVAEALAGLRPVVTNDALTFTAVLARARFTGEARGLSAGEAIVRLRQPFRDHAERLAVQHRPRLRAEQRAFESRQLLASYMASAEHVANSDLCAHHATNAARATGPSHYRLTTLYFSAGYFGLRQAIHLDALRFAIDRADVDEHDRDWMLGAWLAAASTVANAPGHTAQYLKPNTDEAFKRIRRYWRRSIWTEFQDRLIDLKPIGTKAWRVKNRVETMDAVELLYSGRVNDAGAVYADPPYTKDEYGRYYHVYETLYRYDFPDALGESRARTDRFTTEFCAKTAVVGAFEKLFDAVAELGVPLVLSYPTAGLLAEAGSSVAEVVDGRMTITKTAKFSADYSTLGASTGAKTKTATENLYVCQPA